MTTTLPVPARPRRLAHRLILAIGPAAYRVRRIACDPEIAEKAVRLLKADGTAYDVLQSATGPTCDCPDFVFRRDGLDPEGCKHIRALVDGGLIDDRPRRPRAPDQ